MATSLYNDPSHPDYSMCGKGGLCPPSESSPSRGNLFFSAGNLVLSNNDSGSGSPSRWTMPIQRATPPSFPLAPPPAQPQSNTYDPNSGTPDYNASTHWEIGPNGYKEVIGSQAVDKTQLWITPEQLAGRAAHNGGSYADPTMTQAQLQTAYQASKANPGLPWAQAAAFAATALGLTPDSPAAIAAGLDSRPAPANIFDSTGGITQANNVGLTAASYDLSNHLIAPPATPTPFRNEISPVVSVSLTPYAGLPMPGGVGYAGPGAPPIGHLPDPPALANFSLGLLGLGGGSTVTGYDPLASHTFGGNPGPALTAPWEHGGDHAALATQYQNGSVYLGGTSFAGSPTLTQASGEPLPGSGSTGPDAALVGSLLSAIGANNPSSAASGISTGVSAPPATRVTPTPATINPPSPMPRFLKYGIDAVLLLLIVVFVYHAWKHHQHKGLA